jgi:UDP-N-acetylmuramoyl-L-alanyl-D-glutamate--2,6-diaminopimelate ligase
MSGSSLDRLVAAIPELVVRAPADDVPVTRVSYDSRKVEPGTLFVCVPGSVTDGHRFAPEAVASGAVALVVERELDLDVPQLVVSDARKALGLLGAAFFGRPANDLTLIGVTGTNGKTTTAYLVDAVLRADDRVTGLIGTVETRVGGKTRAGVRTTPESLDLQELLAEMRDEGVTAVAMEVTSHALSLHRVEGIRYAVAGFTNLTQDHLDFHTDMEDYFAAKRSLFVPERAERGAVNLDDPYGRRLFDSSEIPCVGFGTAADADIRAEDVSLDQNETRFTIRTPKGDLAIQTGLIGAFNVANCLAAAALCLQAGIAPEVVERGIASLPAVPGRFESVNEGQPFSVVVDYAHTPDSLDNVLRAARGVAERSGGRVLVVFGCGGDRDRGKRPLMGGIAARGADVVLVTSDNPRTEEPAAIVDEILEGVVAQRPQGADFVDVDRTTAINEALSRARQGDVVVIAGKGHETYQEFADGRIDYDDRVVAREALRAAGYGGGA